MTFHETHDTLSFLVQDRKGNLAGACTTSGQAYMMYGRVGDSPIIGAALFVDNEVGCAAATGLGEEVIKSTGSFLVVELMRQGYSPDEACEEALNRVSAWRESRFSNWIYCTQKGWGSRGNMFKMVF